LTRLINQPSFNHPFDRVSFPFLSFSPSSFQLLSNSSIDQLIYHFLYIQTKTMVRRSGRFKAVDEDGDDMEVEGMLVD